MLNIRFITWILLQTLNLTPPNFLGFCIPFLVLNALFSRTHLVYKHLGFHFNPFMDYRAEKPRSPSLTTLTNFQVRMPFKALRFQILEHKRTPKVWSLPSSVLSDSFLTPSFSQFQYWKSPSSLLTKSCFPRGISVNPAWKTPQAPSSPSLSSEDVHSLATIFSALWVSVRISARIKHTVLCYCSYGFQPWLFLGSNRYLFWYSA